MIKHISTYFLTIEDLKARRDFLKDYLSLPNGIPSHDPFRRVFSTSDADALRKCLDDYGKDMIGLLSE